MRLISKWCSCVHIVNIAMKLKAGVCSSLMASALSKGVCDFANKRKCANFLNFALSKSFEHWKSW